MNLKWKTTCEMRTNNFEMLFGFPVNFHENPSATAVHFKDARSLPVPPSPAGSCQVCAEEDCRCRDCHLSR